MAEQTLNIPQLIAVVLVGFLAIRWFLSPASPNQNASSRNAGRQVNPAHVEQIAQMFPQLDRRAIVWDLLRNGGSLQATTERLLSGRSLDTVRARHLARGLDYCSTLCNPDAPYHVQKTITDRDSLLHRSNLRYPCRRRQQLQRRRPQNQAPRIPTSSHGTICLQK